MKKSKNLDKENLIFKLEFSLIIISLLIVIWGIYTKNYAAIPLPLIISGDYLIKHLIKPNEAEQ